MNVYYSKALNGLFKEAYADKIEYLFGFPFVDEKGKRYTFKTEKERDEFAEKYNFNKQYSNKLGDIINE